MHNNSISMSWSLISNTTFLILRNPCAEATCTLTLTVPETGNSHFVSSLIATCILEPLSKPCTCKDSLFLFKVLSSDTGMTLWFAPYAPLPRKNIPPGKNITHTPSLLLVLPHDQVCFSSLFCMLQSICFVLLCSLLGSMTMDAFDWFLDLVIVASTCAYSDPPVFVVRCWLLTNLRIKGCFWHFFCNH